MLYNFTFSASSFSFLSLSYSALYSVWYSSLDASTASTNSSMPFPVMADTPTAFRQL